MKIDRWHNGDVQFRELKKGDVFATDDGMIYIKISNWRQYNAVEISKGYYVWAFEKDQWVRPYFNSKLTLR